MAVGGAVGLKPFKSLLAVMEDVAGRGEGDVAEGDDLGVVPAVLLVPVHCKHVVGEDPAEAELRIGGFCFRVVGELHFDFHNATFP